MAPGIRILFQAELLLSGEGDKEALRKVLKYHMAHPAMEADDMTNGQMLDSDLDGKHLRINLYSTVSASYFT